MRNRSALWLALAIGAGWCGCASAPSAPDGWLPTPEDARRDPRGGWIQVDYVAGGADRLVAEGELLAIDSRRLYIAEDSLLTAVALDSVAEAKLSYFAVNPGAVAGATVGGTLMTITNGWFLVFTAPGWMVLGTGGAASRSRDGRILAKDAGWDEFRMYARFPQGLPPAYGREPIPPPEPPLVVVKPEPPPPPPAIPWTGSPRNTAYWFDVCAGPGFNLNHTGLAFLASANVARRWFMVGTRFTAVDRGSPDAGESDYFQEGGGVYDVALLVGVRGTLGSVQAALSAGPSAYAFSVGDLVDLNGSVAGQAELFVFANEYMGVGSAFGYNWNDIRDFYVVSFGLIFGIP